jgi:electron-transferring-flavoprotein dehydrogenase
MELTGKYVIFAEGARGQLTKQLIARFGLDAGREPQKFGIGIKELWQIDPGSTIRGWFSTPSAGRWTAAPAAAPSSTISMAAWFRSASSSISIIQNPTLSPFDEFQRFKTHKLVRETFEGGKRLSYGARALTEGGYQSVPKLCFPGGVLVGCGAGFMNVPRIKGSHNAMLSGIMAAEAIAPAIAAGRGG